MSSSLPLSPQVFASLSALIEERTGLHYDLHERDLLADRVSGRAVERGLESLLDYYYFLRYDPDAQSELARLADALVVNETYFFREVSPLKVLVEDFLRKLIADGARPRVWCAACSTGEEPLTLAMLLDEAGLLDHVRLVASDISERALSHAKAGVFRRRSLRALPPGVAGRWLDGGDDGMRVAARIAQSVDWHRVNLVDEDELQAMGQFDAIICRNVLIYFQDRTIERVVNQLSQRLLPNGRLLVGASESLLRFDIELTCEEHGGSFFYCRPPK
jgi:chemotaxis protein methyltransferase CheR